MGGGRGSRLTKVGGGGGLSWERVRKKRLEQDSYSINSSSITGGVLNSYTKMTNLSPKIPAAFC